MTIQLQPITAHAPLVQDLADCRDKSLVGGKAVNLGELIRAGFNVPGGFVITTGAYRCGESPLEGRLASEILRAYRALGSPPVAVRSSATAEDLLEASMAGQYDSYLDIATEEQLLDAVQCCWASLDSPRTRTYLAEHGIDLARVAMAVVVQKLVPADVAGVLFCADPRTGSRSHMVIEASWGLGESVVSGRVQPDVLRLDRETGRVLSATIADKRLWIPPGGEERPVEEHRRRIPCLRSADVDKLWKIGRRVQDVFGGPQDVEWAIHDGQLYLLQSRPITTLVQAEAYEQLLQSTRHHLRQRLADGRGPWARHNIAETLKHPTPLTWSIIQPFMSGGGGFGAMYRMAGFNPSPRVSAEGFLERIGGQAYMDLSLAGEMFFEDFPFRYDLDLLRSTPDAAQSPPTIPSGTLRQRMHANRRIAAAGRKLRDIASSYDRQLCETHIPALVAWVAQEKSRDLTSLTTDQLIQCWYDRKTKVFDEAAPRLFLPSLIAAMALSDLRAVLEEHFWDEDPDALAALLASSHAPDRTVQANAALYQVAQGAMPVDQWLAEHGHRAPDEFDLATPRWREQPQALADMAARLRDGADPRQLHDQHAAKVARRLDELRARLSPGEFRDLERHLDLARRYLLFREDGKYYLMLAYDLLRDVALQAGRRLEVAGDVFHLSEEELVDALRVGFAPTHLISTRKTAYAAEEKLKLPPVIDASTIDAIGVSPATPGTPHASRLSAFPLSAGVATGPARIVRSPQDAGDLGKGYVLVCPSTDPNWTPLFVNAAALVLECGGTLSHGAVVAREMNIPAVVLEGATTTLKDGDPITVDGDNGLISTGASAPSPDALPYADGDPDASDVRIPRSLIPPAPGQRERSNARRRNIALAIWGVFLLLAFLLPERWLYQPSIRFLDAVFWPLVKDFGKPAAVAIIAAGMAALTMFMQKLLTDNARLREAKRRAALLNAEAAALPAGSPRRLALTRLASPVQLRLVSAALYPLALLLGPMVMVFLWFPARVDVAAWNAAPGTPVTVVAYVNSNVREPVSIIVPEGFVLDEETPAQRLLPPLRETLEQQVAKWRQPSDLSSLPWDVQLAAEKARRERLEDFEALRAAGIPPQPLSWKLNPIRHKAGKFPVAVRVGKQRKAAIDLVLGDAYPPAPTEVTGDPQTVVSLSTTYMRPQHQLTFFAPFGFLGRTALACWDAGWLGLYLLVYIPVMFALKWLLGVA